MACIIYWQAKEISRVLKSCAPEANEIGRANLAHISPIEWENVILYGQYVINPKLVRWCLVRTYFYTNMGSTYIAGTQDDRYN